MKVEPQSEHHWLDRLVGEWTYETEMSMGPDKPPSKFTGTESVRSLGGLWVICEGRGEMPGSGIETMIITLGYDPVKKRFVGTFIASMMAQLWIYDGELDPATNTLTLNAEGPSFTDPEKMAKYRDIVEIKSDDHRVFRSTVLGEDGQWHEFMSTHHRRVK